MQYDSPIIDKNALVPIIIKAANQEVANSYFSYHRFIKAFYTDLSALCEDIDRAELDVGKIEGQFYPVAEGIIQGESVRMVYTNYLWVFWNIRRNLPHIFQWNQASFFNEVKEHL